MRRIHLLAILLTAQGCGSGSEGKANPTGPADGSAGDAPADQDAAAEAPEASDAGYELSDGNSPDALTCPLPPDCDDGDPKTIDIVDGAACQHEAAIGPAAPERMYADFLCEQKKQATCVKNPPVEFFDYYSCARQKEFETPPYSWEEGGYPLGVLYFKSDLPAKKIRMHLTLRVGVLSDRYQVVVYEKQKEISYGVFSAAELEADQLEINSIPSGDGYWTPIFLQPTGNVASRAVQFSFEGVTDVETGVFYSVGCDGAAWSTYGLFKPVPRHGLLKIGDAPGGSGGCLGVPARRDADSAAKGGFYRTLCDPTVWRVDADLKARHAFGSGQALRSWLFAQPEHDPVLFCARDLVVVPDGVLEKYPIGQPIGQ